MIEKTCKTCKTLKPIKEFNKAPGNKDGYNNSCKLCKKKYAKERGQKNKEKISQKKREKDLKRNYDFTVQEYNLLLRKQKGKCNICGSTDPGKNRKYFPVDHCHLTGKVRGLLCNKCNCALGLLNDDLKMLEKATNYLKKHYDPDLV